MPATDNFAFHADAFGRSADDYRMPSYPYLSAGRPDAAVQRPAAELGAALRRTIRRRLVHLRRRLCRRGGARRFNSLYHIPGLDGDDHDTRIDMHQTKVTSKGEFRAQHRRIDAIRFWLGYTDYKHNEIGLADPADPATRRHPPDLHQQGIGRPRRSPVRAGQSASSPR